MGASKSKPSQAAAMIRDADLVGDRPDLLRVHPSEMVPGAKIVRFWLEKGDRLPLWNLVGESNPVVRIKLAFPGCGNEQVQYSTTKWRTTMPEWFPHERFEFLIPPGVTLQTAKLIVELVDTKALRSNVLTALGVVALHKVPGGEAPTARDNTRERSASERVLQQCVLLRDPKTNKELGGAKLIAKVSTPN